MNLNTDIENGLGVAFNEATLLNVNLHDRDSILDLKFRILNLPDSNKSLQAPAEIKLVLKNIGRIAASLRKGSWNDEEAEILFFEVPDFEDVINQNCGHEIYGWEFFNCHKNDFPKWKKKLSLDFNRQNGSMKNTFLIFQEGDNHLDLCIWFEKLALFSPEGHEVLVHDFISKGQLWWEAFRAGDQRTQGFGHTLLAPEDDK